MCDRINLVTSSIETRNTTLSLTGSTVDNDGDSWDVVFTFNSRKRFPGFGVKVTAKCTSKRAPLLDARNNCNKILDLWPIEFWPEFAKTIAYSHANGNDGTIQEGLF